MRCRRVRGDVRDERSCRIARSGVGGADGRLLLWTEHSLDGAEAEEVETDGQVYL